MLLSRRLVDDFLGEKQTLRLPALQTPPSMLARIVRISIVNCVTRNYVAEKRLPMHVFLEKIDLLDKYKTADNVRKTVAVYESVLKACVRNNDFLQLKMLCTSETGFFLFFRRVCQVHKNIFNQSLSFFFLDAVIAI
ncbi:Hypothetical protein, putative [Bodo saltans]|uniref:Uncharacterized protein n=1 Tax=Bodo saltans TaxID=75058 RepID=A0A0S4JI52_BODSA|nr:Hypothetical protein, putative [Bodo saltans]|eukprot:CUG90203.1 Hypothetical protein, putative [Bodo saltans]